MKAALSKLRRETKLQYPSFKLRKAIELKYPSFKLRKATKR